MEKQKRMLPYILTVICTVIYVSLIFNNNLWLDEAFSASIIRCELKEMISRTINDTLPPFYNVSAWCFTRVFGYSAFVLKLYSVLPMVLLMLVSAHYLTEIFSARTASLYIILITAMPYMLEHGIEIRMYSWALFFASATAVFAICVMREMPRTEALLIICTVLGAYTHQFALIAEAFVWLMLLIFYFKNNNVFLWIKRAVICVVLYIPCAVLTVFQMKRATSYFKATAPTVGAFLSSLRYPFVTHITVLSAMLLFMVAGFFIGAINKRDYTAAYYMVIYVLVTIMAFILMLITGSSFFSSRYLIPAIGILWLGVSIFAGGIPLGKASDNNAADKKEIPAGMLIWSVFLLTILITSGVNYFVQYKQEYVDSSAFEGLMASTGQDDGYVIYEDFPEIQVCLMYYAPWLKAYSEETIGDINGKKYIFVSESSGKPAEILEDEKKYKVRYLGNYAFDRYMFKAYILQ
ncbi:MAG: hypothetical protein K6G03_02430 [Lachnospiraceae bacterium]|nr:hypothetical protein [Lachnospiraceae bacterium]